MDHDEVFSRHRRVTMIEYNALLKNDKQQREESDESNSEALTCLGP